MKIKIVKGLMTLFLITMMQQASAAIPASERNALIALYNSTDGDNWADNTGWLGSPGTECSWEGVECNGNSITEITLRSNSLTGNIPPELGQLLQLRNLDLRFNQLTSIPAELGQLSQLTQLHLSFNQLTGSIPPELGQLSQLTGLHLSFNQLTGSIPPELGQLSQLTGLHLRNNQLTGRGQLLINNTPPLARATETGPEVEPNNTPGDANGILVNEYQINKFDSPDDEDWLVFHSWGGGDNIYIRATQKHPVLPMLNIALALEIYNESGEIVVSLLDSILDPHIWLDEGLHYIRIMSTEATFSATESYKVGVYTPHVFSSDSNGIIRGKVIDSCTKIGIKGAIIENNLIKKSTKSLGKNGKFGMSLLPRKHNPITISHKKYKTQEIPTSMEGDCRGCSGEDVDLGAIQLVPIKGCNNPPINDITTDTIKGFIPAPDFFSNTEHIKIESLKQQAIAVYDDVTGILTIKEVKVGNDIFEAILKESQAGFTLVSAILLSKGISNNPAVFNFDTLLADIPHVFYLNQLYSMQLRQLPSGNTFIIQNKILLP